MQFIPDVLFSKEKKKEEKKTENTMNKVLYSKWGIIPLIVQAQSMKAYQTASREKKRKKVSLHIRP